MAEKSCSNDEKGEHLLRRSLVCAQALFAEHFILLALAIAVLFAFLLPSLGQRASRYELGFNGYGLIEFCNNVLVFLVSGLTLKVEEMTALWRRKLLVLYGLCTINFLTSLVVFGTAALPFATDEFRVGISIFCVVPTTLGVGVALTAAARGDIVFSLFLTVASNILGIVTVPYLLQFYFPNSESFVSDPSKLVFRLTLTVLLPTLVGLAVRLIFSAHMVPWTKAHKQSLSMFSMANLMCMVWMSLSKARDNLLKQDPWEILGVLAVNLVIHAFFLACNYLLLWRSPFVKSRVEIAQAVSLLIMCSQKSSPVALSVIAGIAGSDSSSANKGLLTIPCILGQLVQILCGYIYTRPLAKLVNEEESERRQQEEKERTGGQHKSEENKLDLFHIFQGSADDDLMSTVEMQAITYEEKPQ